MLLLLSQQNNPLTVNETLCERAASQPDDTDTQRAALQLGRGRRTHEDVVGDVVRSALGTKVEALGELEGVGLLSGLFRRAGYGRGVSCRREPTRGTTRRTRSRPVTRTIMEASVLEAG